MKALTVLFDEQNKFQNDKVFFGKSAAEVCSDFYTKADYLPEDAENAGIEYINAAEIKTTAELTAKISQLAKEKNADFVIYSYADLPFLNAPLTKRLAQTHIEYKCEYTFFEGYPYGFTPEFIDAGTIAILSELAKNSQKEEGEKPVCRESIFNLIKTDINSFEVETEIADADWRLLRFHFDCENKDCFLQCKNLFAALEKRNLVKDESSLFELDVNKASEIASNNEAVLKTVPGFYNIQLCSKSDTKPLYEVVPENQNDGEFMPLEKFTKLCKKIADFSESAVLNLGYCGEPLLHGDFLSAVQEVLKFPGLSVFFETSGLCATEDFCSALKKIIDEAEERTNGYQKVMIAVRLDSVSPETYAVVNGTEAGNFNKALYGCDLLCKNFPGLVYPQFTRMNQNEAELESFFRYWNEKSNPSSGNCIIQKYNDFSALLPSCKPADLSPIERNVCWHLRRDMTIFADGKVFACPNIFENARASKTLEKDCLGNAFDDDIEKIWKKTDSMILDHAGKKYCDYCRKCDEYYTFNF